jgi:hypothetical protein
VEISSFHKDLDIFKSANYAANMIVCSTFSPMIEKKINYYSEDIRKFWYKPHIFEWYYDEISSFHKYLDIFKSANYAANMIVCSTFSTMIEKKIN